MAIESLVQPVTAAISETRPGTASTEGFGGDRGTTDENPHCRCRIGQPPFVVKNRCGHRGHPSQEDACPST